MGKLPAGEGLSVFSRAGHRFSRRGKATEDQLFYGRNEREIRHLFVHRVFENRFNM